MRGKLRGDPVYAAGCEALQHSVLPVLDVGCGLGLFAFFLRERGYAPALTGIDFDATKIAQAQGIADRAYRDLSFRVGDVMATGDFQGNIALFDVIHYLPADRHAALLEHLAELVAPGGLCLIRSTLREAHWRFRITQMEEFFLRASRWMKSGALHYPSGEEILAPFRARDFTCEVRPLWGRTPFNSYLFLCRRPRSTPPSETAG